MPVSEEEISCSPIVISMNGTVTWTNASTTSGPSRSRRPVSAPMWAAAGRSTIAARAQRANTMKAGAMSSSSATLMNRYEAPQKAESSPNITQERRDTRTRIAESRLSVQMKPSGRADKLS